MPIVSPHPAPIMSVFGKDTEFEAEVLLWWSEDGMWDGRLEFEDERFSPPDADVPLIKLNYFTPRAGNGALAMTRAVAYYQLLVGVFKSLMSGG